jgi:DNA repair protein RadC
MNLFLNNLSEVKISYSSKVPAKDRPVVRCSRDAVNNIRLFFPDVEYKESFFILLMSRSNKILGFNQISSGGISGTITDIRLIFQAAIKSNACGMILAHNHPSGALNPSEADKLITKKVFDAGKILDITVLDHIIITQDSYFSFADENLM